MLRGRYDLGFSTAADQKYAALIKGNGTSGLIDIHVRQLIRNMNSNICNDPIQVHHFSGKTVEYSPNRHVASHMRHLQADLH
jgi:hypothetical protein